MNRILLQLAAAAGLVFVAATSGTYRLVHAEAERQGLNHLSDYALRAIARRSHST